MLFDEDLPVLLRCCQAALCPCCCCGMVEPEVLVGGAALLLRGMVREALDPFGSGGSAMIPVADARPTCIVAP